MSRDGWAALPRGATGLSAVCDCGISWSYSLTIFEDKNQLLRYNNTIGQSHPFRRPRSYVFLIGSYNEHRKYTRKFYTRGTRTGPAKMKNSLAISTVVFSEVFAWLLVMVDTIVNLISTTQYARRNHILVVRKMWLALGIILECLRNKTKWPQYPSVEDS